MSALEFARIVSNVIPVLVLLLAIGLSPSQAQEPSTAAALSIFPPAADVAALFEFNGNVEDSSGNARHATLLGGHFVQTSCGSALAVNKVEGEAAISCTDPAAPYRRSRRVR